MIIAIVFASVLLAWLKQYSVCRVCAVRTVFRNVLIPGISARCCYIVAMVCNLVPRLVVVEPKFERKHGLQKEAKFERKHCRQSAAPIGLGRRAGSGNTDYHRHHLRLYQPMGVAANMAHRGRRHDMRKSHLFLMVKTSLCCRSFTSGRKGGRKHGLIMARPGTHACAISSRSTRRFAEQGCISRHRKGPRRHRRQTLLHRRRSSKVVVVSIRTCPLQNKQGGARWNQ